MFVCRLTLNFIISNVFVPTVVVVMITERRQAAPRTRAKASIGQGAFPPSPICSFICQDQLLALAVFLSCPLERGGSQLERGARGYALSPLCGETHGVLERLGAGAGRKSEREHTWGPFVSSQKSGMFFFEGPFFFLFFLQGYLLSVGQIYWRYTRLEGEERPSTSSAGRDTWL